MVKVKCTVNESIEYDEDYVKCTNVTSIKEKTDYDLPAFYGCADFDPDVSNPAAARELNYDYEVYMIPEANPTSAVRVLEGRMLEHVASELGLFDCILGRRNWLRRRSLLGLEQADRSLSEPDFGFAGISSQPDDIPDVLQDGCTDELDIEFECTPMRGSMSVFFEDDSKLSPATDKRVLGILQNGAENNVFLSDDILKVVYVGTRAGEVNKNQTVVQRQGSKARGGLSLLGITLTSAFAACAIVLGVGLYLRRHHKKGRQEDGSFPTFPVNARMPATTVTIESPTEASTQCFPCSVGVVAEPVEGANVPGSLAARDSLAIKNRGVDDLDVQPTLTQLWSSMSSAEFSAGIYAGTFESNAG